MLSPVHRRDSPGCRHYYGGPTPEYKEEPEEQIEEDVIDADTQILIDQARVLGANNQELVQWLGERGAQINGLGETRHEMYFAFLREVGIIPLKAGALFEVRWGRYLNERLCALKKEGEEYLANQESERIRQTLLDGVPGAHAAQMLKKNARPSHA